MKRIIFILILVLCSASSYAQNVDSTETKVKRTLRDIQRNSVYLGSHILTIDAFYDRIIPLKDKFGLVAGAGIIQVIGFTTETNPTVKTGYLLGNNKHSFENGVMISPWGSNKFLPYLGYRFQHLKGFLLRVDVSLAMGWGTYVDGSGKWFEVNPFPGLSLGYSF